MRELPNFNQEYFRSQLQRTLSISTSGSENTQSPSRSAAGDTTEESSYHENDSLSDLHNTNSEHPPQIYSIGPTSKGEQELLREADLSRDYSMIAFHYIAELDIRTNDLKDIRSQLAGVETALAIMARGGDDTIESDANRRTRRPQQ
ncbi:unnamed protein product [Penicillium roqueforti FM164]|uniref:Uncharacterized protein n=1 Tax=Penicillium roqueforti (strain FM164) TaxID=1365484 RepID=W6R9D6_PENRF|nr:unnamed protein product [Penicillium roqueforti FM164]